MYHVTEDTDNFVALHFSGQLEKADYDKLIPYLESKIDKHGKINLYWEMDDFEGWDAAAAWKDLKFDVKHANDFKRVAMVGDAKWQDWMTQLMKPFTSAEVKYFNRKQRIQAQDWARG